MSRRISAAEKAAIHEELATALAERGFAFSITPSGEGESAVFFVELDAEDARRLARILRKENQ